MKTHSMFFVSLLALAAFLSGCAHSSYQPMVLNTSSFLGSSVKFGITERSDVTVHNQYPYLAMEACLQVVSYPNWAWRGDGRDPLMGSLPKPIFGSRSRSYNSLVNGQDLVIPSHCVVLEHQFLAVLVTWRDSQGRVCGKGSEMLYPGNTYYPWHLSVSPSIGRFGSAFNGDAVTFWNQ